MKVHITTTLAARPELVWRYVQTVPVLRFVSSPLLVFTSREADGFRMRWPDGPHPVRVWLFGAVPLGAQTIDISRGHGPDGHWLRDAGSGTFVAMWDHTITIGPAPGGGTLYADEVEIRAGLLTPLVAGFAHAFYRWRQKRWHVLAERMRKRG